MTLPQNFKVDFMGIGTPKCGTEWLLACLEEHPQIDFSKHKELNFFRTTQSEQTSDMYRVLNKLEDYPNEFSNDPSKVKVEFSITYIFDYEAMKKVKQTFPEIKVIVSLRDPVSYLYSAYWYMKNSFAHDDIPDSFEKAIKSPKPLKSTGNIPPFYIERAKFSQHIEQCFSVFGKERTHIVLLDDIKANPENTIRNLYNFMNIDSNFKPSSLNQKINKTRLIRFPFIFRLINKFVKLFNKIGLGKILNHIINTQNPIRDFYRNKLFKESTYPPINKQTESELKKYFEDDIYKLSKLIDRDLSSWKE